MGKLFFTIVNRRLEWWAETNKVVNVTQFGVGKNHRTTLSYLHHELLDLALRKEEENIIIYNACFIVFKKAFDSVNHLTTTSNGIN